MLVKEELAKLGLQPIAVELGEAEILGMMSAVQYDQFKWALSKSGLRWPRDAEVRAALLRLPLYTEGRHEQRRLLLETLEESYGHKEAVDLSTLTIEHIMPQALTPEWHAALGDDA